MKELSKIGMGVKIAERRQELGLSQTELAERCFTTQGQISRYELGMRFVRIDTLYRMAQVLECTIDDLVCEAMPSM